MKALPLLTVLLLGSPLNLLPKAEASLKAATTSVTLNEKQILSQFSLEDLDAALQGITLALEGKDWCGTTPDNAKLLLLPLRPIYEKKFDHERKSASWSALGKKAKECKQNCQCSLYLELLAGKKGTPKEKIEEWRKIDRETKAEDRDVCLKEHYRLCKTPLLPSLRALALKDYSPVGTNE